MSKNLFHALAALVMQAATAGLICACGEIDNSVIDSGTTPTNVVDNDIVNSKIVHFIDVDKIDDYMLPLATLEDVDVKLVDKSENYGVEVVEVDGQRYLKHIIKKEPAPGLERVIIHVTPKGKPEKSRHVVLLFLKKVPENQITSTNSSIDPSSSTSDYDMKCAVALGRGTFIFNDFDNEGVEIIKHDDLKNIENLAAAHSSGDKFLKFNEFFRSAKVAQGNMWEKSYSNLSEAEDSWSIQVGVGVSGSFGKGNRISGSLNYGQSESTAKKSSMEYNIQCYEYAAGYMGLRMGLLSKEKSPNYEAYVNSLLYVTDTDFIDWLKKEDASDNSWKFNVNNFYDTYGTDIITQFSLGCRYSYLYGRRSNCYATSVSYDAGVSVQYTKTSTDSASNDWMLTLAKAIANNLKGSSSNPGGSSKFNATVDVDWSLHSSDYQEYSYAYKKQTFLGGEPRTDLNSWAQSLNSSNYVLTSYRTPSDIELSGDSAMADTTLSRLYPIGKFAENIVDGYNEILKKDSDNISPADSIILERMYNRVKQINDYRQTYIDNHMYDMEEDERLIVADFMAVNLGSDHDNEPLPMMMQTKRDKKWRMYYPIMANENNPEPTYTGYGLDVSGNDYINVDDDRDQYFYYTLDYANECDGIIDIIMEQDDWDKFGSTEQFTLWDGATTAYYRDYTPVGETSYVGDNDDENRVHLLYYDRKHPDDYPEKIRITAIGLTKLDSIDVQPSDSAKRVCTNPNMIIGSTGGSELVPNPGKTVRDEWYAWWNQGYINKPDHIWHDQKHKMTQFCACYTNRPLRISKLNESNVYHPKPWRERK